ncbi:MAG TPA: hypothetical protein VIH86_00800 [Puia sp.]
MRTDIDTIRIHVDTRKIKVNVDFIVSQLKDTKWGEFRNGHKYFTGKLENFTVIISQTIIKIFGSLSMFYHKNNIQSLQYLEMKGALDRLCQMLGFNIYLGKLVRVDVGASLFTIYPVKNYLNLFQEDPQLKGYCRYRTTILCKLENYSVQFYDKIAQMLANDRTIPLDFHHKYVLRYEVQFTNHLQVQFHRRDLRVLHLLNTSFLNQLHEKWFHSFFNLYRRPKLRLVDTDLTPRKLADFSVLSNIETRCGIKIIYTTIDDQFKKGILTKAQRQYKRHILQKLYNSPDFLKPDSLYEELVEKIKNVFKATWQS